MQQIDLFHQLCLKFPERFRLAENSKQAMAIFRSGGIAGLLGLEGLHQIGNSASVLRLFHRLGVRYITLCHSESNQYADSAVRTLRKAEAAKTAER
jgi:membrane dipeptidase